MPAPTSTHRRVTALILALALLALAPTLVSAQGGLLKKAKDKIAGNPAETGPPPKFTDKLLELTNERIDAYLRGIAAGQLVKSPGGLTIAELNRRAEGAFQKRTDLMQDKDDELATYKDADYRFNQCVRDQLRILEKENEKAMMAKLAGGSNMELIQKISEASGEVAKRYAANDTAGAIKAQNALMKLYGVDQAADTLKARSKCGKAPVKPKWLIEAEAQLKLGNTSLDEARSIELKVREERANKSGLTQTQFGLAHERILAFVNADGKPGSSWKFSGDERSALKRRMEEIRKAVIG